MISFERDTLYDWLSDYDGFSYVFKKYCVYISQAFAVDIRFDSNTLKLAHEKWAEECEIWRTQHFPDEAEALSEIKVASLLLLHLATAPYVATLVPHTYTSDLHYVFAGSKEQYEEARADLIAAREVILALDFCLSIVCYYEENRIDRVEDFVMRMTPELRHDIISYLVSRQADSKALYLILNALFVRTKKPKAPTSP